MRTPARRNGSIKPPRSHAAALKHFQHCRLERGPVGFMMRHGPLLHDARLNAMAKEFMAKEFASREQSRWPGPNNQSL